MCEWVNTCPTTGKSIEDAPCRAIASIMHTCKISIRWAVDPRNWRDSLPERPIMIQSPGVQDGGIGLGVFLEENWWRK